MLLVASNNHFKHGFTVTGHAHYAEEGRDIVCSAVSVLTQILGTQMAREGYGKVQINKGYMEVKMHTTNDRTDTLARTLERGMHEIMEQFPEYVKIVEK